MKDNKKNFFYLHDKKIFKIFWWITSAFFAISLVTFVMLYGGMIYDYFATGDIESIIPAFGSVVGVLLIVLFVVFIAYLTVFVYNFVSNAAQYAEGNEAEEVVCPLCENVKQHKAEISAMLKTIAKPEPGTNNLNRANTIHFLRTLKSMGLIDPNENSKILMVWVLQVTGYEEKSFSAFNQAMTKQKENPALVAEYHKQLEQIIAS